MKGAEPDLSAATFQIFDESHTMGNALRWMIMKKCVETPPLRLTTETKGCGLAARTWSSVGTGELATFVLIVFLEFCFLCIQRTFLDILPSPFVGCYPDMAARVCCGKARPSRFVAPTRANFSSAQDFTGVT